MEKFNPHSNEWLIKKFETYKELRASNTAYWSEKYKMHVITRYTDVIFALNNPEIFKSNEGNLIVEDPMRFSFTLGASDNPTHDIYKTIVKKAYSKENIERITCRIPALLSTVLTDKTSVNISSLIEEISAWTTAELINFPYDMEKVKDIIVDVQRHAPQCVSENIDSKSYNKFKSIVYTLLIVSKTPSTGPGIYNEFINNNPENLQIMSLFTGPIISGTSSMTGALEFLTLDLYRENQLDSLIADRTLIPKAINESLRFHASTGRFSRTVTQDITLHNVQLKAGDRVALCLESANRDPEVFENPEVFDLSRNTSPYLAFGHGVHACIALAISKAVMTIYLESLLDMFGKYKVVTKPEDFKYIMTASGNDDMISNLIIEQC
jgi:cytochrome P450